MEHASQTVKRYLLLVALAALTGCTSGGPSDGASSRAPLMSVQIPVSVEDGPFQEIHSAEVFDRDKVLELRYVKPDDNLYVMFLQLTGEQFVSLQEHGKLSLMVDKNTVAVNYTIVAGKSRYWFQCGEVPDIKTVVIAGVATKEKQFLMRYLDNAGEERLFERPLNEETIGMLE